MSPLQITVGVLPVGTPLPGCPLQQLHDPDTRGRVSLRIEMQSAILSDGAFAYFFPKLTAQMAAVRGTASITPMELATPEMASRLMYVELSSCQGCSSRE